MTRSERHQILVKHERANKASRMTSFGREIRDSFRRRLARAGRMRRACNARKIAAIRSYMRKHKITMGYISKPKEALEREKLINIWE